MKSFRTKPVNSGRLLGGGGALVLAIWLATAIASPAQTFTTLASFNGSNGRNPQATLVQGRDGNLYGTAMIGGADKWGTVFKLTRAGKVTRLYNFCSQRNCADGNSPFAGLVLSTDGNFYGTTIDGGVGPGYGTVFEITPASKLTTLYSFCSQSNCADGAFPYAGLVKATDGSFYGTTWGGGGGLGTVFKITPAGKLTTLSNFCSQGNCAGREPYAGLVQATDGNFYGTTEFGGVKDSGTVFKITRAGKLTTLYSFCSLSNCADGKNGYAGLVQATDGNLYGTTQTGGASGYGTVFKITRAGKLTTLYSFCSQNNCADGEEPFAGLVQATDGNFYGTTFYGGAINGAGGTVFKITPAGKLTTLYSFCSQSKCADGQQPHAGLVQATDGNLYGTTSAGGAYKWGTVFSLSTGLSPFVTFVRTSGKVGQTAQILGQGLTGTTAVSFNGTAASFVVHSDTYLTATIPSGASTGYVTVTTPSGTLKSKVRFRVIP